MKTSRQLWKALLFVLPLVSGDRNSTDICLWERPRVAQVRDNVYIEGGFMQLAKDGSCDTPETATSAIGWMFNLSLHEAFDISDGSTPAVFRSINAPTATYFLDGFLFADTDELVAWGGMPMIAGDINWPYTLSVPLYDAAENSTIQLGVPMTFDPENGAFLPRTNGAGTNVPSEDLAFYFGGMYNANGEKFTYTNVPKNQSMDLIKVKLTNQRHPDFEIFPLVNTSSIDPPWRAEGGLVWLPTSSQGLLVAIGGVISPRDLKIKGNQDNSTVSQRFLKEFPIYDIGSNTWAVQYLDPSSPFPDKPMAQFCTVVASNSDGTQHDIFVYGGSDGNNTVPNGDVWILSIPSFIWTKADIGGKPGVARQSHTCLSPYQDTMIVLGGTNIGATSLGLNQIVDVYNLNNLNWTGSYRPDPETHVEYQRHSTIEGVVSKTPIASNMSAQVSGWFAQKYEMDRIKFYGPYLPTVVEPPAANGTGTGNVTDPGNTTPENPPLQPASDRKWVVPVAAAVPSVSVVLIVALAILLCRRKRPESEDADLSHPNRPKSWILRWIRGTHQSHRDVGSDTMTEVDQAPPKSPIPSSPGLQELADTQKRGYFASVQSDGTSHHRWSSTTPARSPLDYDVHQVEAPDNPVHEVEGRQRPLPTEQVNYDIRKQPNYPPSILSAGNHAFSTTGSQSTPAPEDYPASGPLGGPLAPAPTSPRHIAVFPQDDYAHPDGFGPLDLAVSPLVDRPNQRPRHRRHKSSVSSGMSLPSPGEQSPSSVPRTTRSLSGEHNILTAPSVQDEDIQRANQTY